MNQWGGLLCSYFCCCCCCCLLFASPLLVKHSKGASAGCARTEKSYVIIRDGRRTFSSFLPFSLSLHLCLSHQQTTTSSQSCAQQKDRPTRSLLFIHSFIGRRRVRRASDKSIARRSLIASHSARTQHHARLMPFKLHQYNHSHFGQHCALDSSAHKPFKWSNANVTCMCLCLSVCRSVCSCVRGSHKRRKKK